MSPLQALSTSYLPCAAARLLVALLLIGFIQGRADASVWVKDSHELFRPGAGQGGNGDGFGGTLATRDDLLVAGAANADGNGFSQDGSLFVFRKRSSRWTFEARLTLPPRATPNRLGYFVATDGARILAGSINGLQVFERIGETWTSTTVGQELQQWQVARIAGDRIVAIPSQGNGDPERLCSFVRIGLQWQLRSCDTVYTQVDGNQRMVLDYDGSTVTVGGSSFDDHQIQWFHFEGDVLVRDATITRPGASVGDWLSIGGDLTGAAVSSAQQVEVYQRGQTGWTLEAEWREQDPAPATLTSLREGLFVVRFYGHGEFAYRRVDGTWARVGALPRPPGADPDHQPLPFFANVGGVAVVDGTHALLGSERFYELENDNDGIVYEIAFGAGTPAVGDVIAAGNAGEGIGFGAYPALRDGLLAIGSERDRIEMYRRRFGNWVDAGQVSLPVYTEGRFGPRDVAIGANEDLIFATWRNSEDVWVYRKSGATWAQHQRISSPAQVNYAGFGSVLAAHGQWLAVGAPTFQTGDIYGGAGFLYERSATGWVLKQQFINDGPDASPGFGGAVALSDDVLVWAADPSKGYLVSDKPGTIHVYERVGESFVHVAEFPGSPPTGIAAPLGWGDAVAAMKDVIAIESFGANGFGIRVVERTATGWDRQYLVDLPVGASATRASIGFSAGELCVSVSFLPEGQLAARDGIAVYSRDANGWHLSRVLEGPAVSVPGWSRLAADSGHLVLGSDLDAGPNGYQRAGRVSTWSSTGDAVSLSAAAGGVWYDPSRSGEGWLIELLPDDQTLAIWFTFPKSGSDAAQAWILGQGTRSGNRLVFDDAITTSGPSFGNAYQAALLRFHSWGLMEFTMGPCGAGLISYRSRDGVERATRELTQIVPLGGIPCSGPLFDPQARQFDGTWYDPARTGEGILLQFPDSSRVIATWFTYDGAGRQAWLIGEGQRAGQMVQFNTMLRPVGTHFGSAFDAADVNRSTWGSMRIDFLDCNHIALTYQSMAPGFDSGVRQMTRITQPEGTACD